jgi:Tfp pilus assembly protein PilO
MRQRKPLPRAAIFGLIGAGVLLVAVVGYLMLVKPEKSRLADIKQQIEQTQNTINLYKQEAAAQQPNAAPSIRVADVYRLARAMPAALDMPDVLLELSSVAQSSGVVIDSVTPNPPPTAGNGFEIVPLTLQFHGDFYALTDFLYRVRTLVGVHHGQLLAGGRLFALQNVSLTSSPGSQALSVQAELDTYIYGASPSGSTPAAPAPATTTGTTTASTTTSSSASAEGAP